MNYDHYFKVGQVYEVLDPEESCFYNLKMGDLIKVVQVQNSKNFCIIEPLNKKETRGSYQIDKEDVNSGYVRFKYDENDFLPFIHCTTRGGQKAVAVPHKNGYSERCHPCKD